MLILFFLNEVHPELYFKLDKRLPGFVGHYEKGNFFDEGKVFYGQSAFVKSGITLNPLSKIYFGKRGLNKIIFMVPYEISIKGRNFLVINVHGVSKPGHKLDTSLRLRQSQTILKLAEKFKGPKIIGGDFNLLPRTKSVKMIEKAGYLNLITQFGIKTTRNSLSWSKFPNKKQYFADYVFTSPEIKIANFEVPQVKVSDHLPLILDFEV